MEQQNSVSVLTATVQFRMKIKIYYENSHQEAAFSSTGHGVHKTHPGAAYGINN